MLLEQINVKTASRLISDHDAFVTCFYCCKYFIVPKTAVCGHTLCHLCWISCQNCPTCGKKVYKKSLTLVKHLSNTVDHVRKLVKSFERIFGIKMGEIDFDMSTPTQDIVILPVVKVSSNKIQVHTETYKNASLPKVPHIAPPQDDWDTKETVPDTEEITEKNKDNVVGPKVVSTNEMKASCYSQSVAEENNAVNKEVPITVNNTNYGKNLLDTSHSNDDEIHITIKIGSVVTNNTTVNKNRSDVKFNVNADQEVQASLRPNETATVQYEIAESVEKELSNIMECEEADDPANVSTQVESVKRLGTTQRSKGKTVTQIDKTTIKGKIADNPEENLDWGEVTVQTLKNTCGPPSNIMNSRKAVIADTQVEPSDTENVPAPKNIDQEYSENMFSTIGNIDADVAGPETQKHIDTLLTPGMCRDLGVSRDQTIAPEAAGDVIDNVAYDVMANLGTPAMDDDSDKSMVEETPQKNNSKHAIRNGSGNRTVGSNKKLNLQPARVSTDTPDINVTDNSTPVVAIKSLNFTQNETEDDDAALCPSVHEVAQTTQEKELMSKAFATKKYVIAGSCLGPTKSSILKLLCFKMKWLFVGKFTPDLTHLVVGVDDENRCQRSVKYMCALAAGKWIVSYKWVERCLEGNNILDVEAFEAAVPRRSRLATHRLFQGFTFYCMTPFTLLHVDTLKAMLEAAGASVVTHVSGVRVKENSPALLLAEHEDTQECKYIYIAEVLQVIPVNYKWALNCLRDYSLCSLLDLLLCPVHLLPMATQTWPSELLPVEAVSESGPYVS